MLRGRWRQAILAAFSILLLISIFGLALPRFQTLFDEKKFFSWLGNGAHPYWPQWLENDRSWPPAPPLWEYSKTELVSLTTFTGEPLPIRFRERNGTLYNPNVIPHPAKPNTWIVLVRKYRTGDDPHREWYCEASLKDGAMECHTEHRELTVVTQKKGNCTGPDQRFNLERNRGPRDARIFYGPDKSPYIVFGSFGTYNCQGMWLQNARTVLDSFNESTALQPTAPFAELVEVQRPPPYGAREKNFFVFWDANESIYAHQDMWPQRIFTSLNTDGSVGENLGVLSAQHDQSCMSRYMPLVEDGEEIHQATNSLSITLCNRHDSFCIPSDSNTFIMHIFHHNSRLYRIYDAYVVLFQRSAPFALHAISGKPLSVRGRMQPPVRAVRGIRPRRFSRDFFYTTSMNWKDADQTYHGYLDDVIFLAFGIKDSRPVVIDVRAEDLLRDLSFC